MFAELRVLEFAPNESVRKYESLKEEFRHARDIEDSNRIKLEAATILKIEVLAYAHLTSKATKGRFLKESVDVFSLRVASILRAVFDTTRILTCRNFEELEGLYQEALVDLQEAMEDVLVVPPTSMSMPEERTVEFAEV